jgi:hypothetical protein
MALQGNDLLVVQSQTDSELYKLKVSDLDIYLEGSSGVQFRGTVDLNNGASAQTPAVTLPAANGDLYIVESDAASINADWIMEGGVTSANENDRIVWDNDSSYWVLVAGGTSTGGTVTDITATLPLKSDGDAVTPVLTINPARTSDAATLANDGEGTSGSVARLADADDVKHTDGTGDATAVVTANLLKATNDIVEGLATSAGGVQTVTTTDVNNNDALTINPTSGNVVIELNTSSESVYGVVKLADSDDILNEVAGASAVIDAAQLATALDGVPDEAITSIVGGGTDVVAGALKITTTAADSEGKKTTTIGVADDAFCPYDFSSLTDINA